MAAKFFGENDLLSLSASNRLKDRLEFSECPRTFEYESCRAADEITERAPAFWPFDSWRASSGAAAERSHNLLSVYTMNLILTLYSTFRIFTKFSYNF